MMFDLDLLIAFVGDVHSILLLQDKRGSKLFCCSEVQKFQQFVDAATLKVLDFTSLPYTWCNNGVGPNACGRGWIGLHQ